MVYIVDNEYAYVIVPKFWGQQATIGNGRICDLQVSGKRRNLGSSRREMFLDDNRGGFIMFLLCQNCSYTVNFYAFMSV